MPKKVTGFAGGKTQSQGLQHYSHMHAARGCRAAERRAALFDIHYAALSRTFLDRCSALCSEYGG